MQQLFLEILLFLYLLQIDNGSVVIVSFLITGATVTLRPLLEDALWQRILLFKGSLYMQKFNLTQKTFSHFFERPRCVRDSRKLLQLEERSQHLMVRCASWHLARFFQDDLITVLEVSNHQLLYSATLSQELLEELGVCLGFALRSRNI
jgi:hypothetical protein